MNTAVVQQGRKNTLPIGARLSEQEHLRLTLHTGNTEQIDKVRYCRNLKPSAWTCRPSSRATMEKRLGIFLGSTIQKGDYHLEYGNKQKD